MESWISVMSMCLAVSIFAAVDVSAQELKLKVGDKAPEFKAQTYEGKSVSLKDFAGKKNVVLYFYPKDDTPGCTKEACSFRDNLKTLEGANAAVIGVSVDDVKSHEAFRDKFNLNFDLVADTDQSIVKKYGVERTGKNGAIMANRVTFLIDKKGVIRHIWAPVQVDGHTEQVLATIAELKM